VHQVILLTCIRHLYQQQLQLVEIRNQKPVVFFIVDNLLINNPENSVETAPDAGRIKYLIRRKYFCCLVTAGSFIRRTHYIIVFFSKLFQMKQFILSATFFLLIVQLFAQAAKVKKRTNTVKSDEIKIPMQPAYWEYDTSTTEFVNYKNTEAVRGKNGKGYQVFLKNNIFKNGTMNSM
jgi:hypothetical protein